MTVNVCVNKILSTAHVLFSLSLQKLYDVNRLFTLMLSVADEHTLADVILKALHVSVTK